MIETDAAMPPDDASAALVPAAGAARLPAPAEKAAIILAAVGPELAARFLRGLPEPEARRFARAAEGLAGVGQDVMDAVIGEFLDVLSAASEDAGAAENAPARPDRLDGAPPEALALMLQSEHPQAAAVILRAMPGARAALVLDAIDRDFARSMMLRLARLPELDAELTASVMTAFAESPEPQERPAPASPCREDMISGLISGTSADARQAFLSDIEPRDPGLARDLRRKLITFDEIAQRMRGADIDLAARDVAEPVLLAALKYGRMQASASAGFILDNLPAGTAVRYAGELARHDPVSPADGDAAQLALLRAIEALVASGAIRLEEPA